MSAVLILPLLPLLLAGARCRYTVRDIGFVDLQGPLYELDLVAPAGFALDDAARAALSGAAADGNVAWERVDPGAMPDHPAVAALDGDASARGARWVLRRDGLAPLTLGDGGELDVRAALERALSSPAREDIVTETLESFAFVVIAEGRDAAANARAREVADRAARRLREIEPQLPRPIAWPLRTRVVPLGERGRERVLLWSLGATEECETLVAVLYGRGKLAGAPLIGAGIEERELLAQLALVGESCECDTDRDWASEPEIPLRWTARQRQRAAEALGFDPESPLVKAEVVRILARGPLDPSPLRAGERRDSLAALLLGYRETGIGPADLAPRTPTTVGDPAPPPGARTAGVEAVGAGKGDWAFADEGPRADPAPEESAPTGSMPLAPLLLAVGAFAALSVAGALLVLFRRRPA